MFRLNNIAAPCLWWRLNTNIDDTVEDGFVGSVGLNWIIYQLLDISSILESVGSSIIAHNVEDIEMMTGSLQWVHPHTTVGALRLGIGVLTVVVSSNREWSGRKKDLLVSRSIVCFQGIAEVFNQVSEHLVSGAYWTHTLKLAPWLILVVEIDTIKIILIDEFENALDLVLRHSGAWEWESGTADTQKQLSVWALLSKF